MGTLWPGRVARWVAVVALVAATARAADQPIAVWEVPYPECSYVTSSPDGRYAASVHLGSHHNSWHAIKLWKRSPGRELRLAATLTVVERRSTSFGNEQFLKHLVFSPDSRMLATRNEDDSTTVWETASGKERLRLNTQGLVVAFGERGRTVITVSRDGRVQHWDLATGKCVAPADSAELDEYLLVTDAIASADGSRVAYTDGYSIVFKDAHSGKTLRRVDDGHVLGRPDLSSDGRSYSVRGNRYNLATGIMLSRDWRLGMMRKAATPPLEATIVSRQAAYTLDLHGKTTREYARLVREGISPPAFGVDLVLTLRNTSRESVAFDPECTSVDLYLVGPGAMNHPPEAYQTIFVRRERKEVTIAPGQSYTIPIRSLDCGHSLQFYWVLPGEYTLHTTCYGFWDPPRYYKTEEEAELDMTYGFRGIQPSPLRLKVVAGKK